MICEFYCSIALSARYCPITESIRKSRDIALNPIGDTAWASGDREHALGHQLAQRMIHLAHLPLVSQTGAQPATNP
jgi:hypothetical protein